MKILYAVQATGNGHISRAMELLPHLQQYGSVDVFLSGANSTLAMDAPVKYRSKGLSLFYNCKGGLDYWKLVKKIQPARIRKEIQDLPVEKYDLVINDFEYITAAACARKGIPSVNFGHQASFQSIHTPRPEKQSIAGEWLLKNYAKASQYVGLHFSEYDDFIFTPIIKKEILQAEPTDNGHITVYLPSYCEPELVAAFSQLNDFHFEIFSHQATSMRVEGNITLLPVSKQLFNESFVHGSAIITGGGFETPAEAIHLGKKLMSIPIRGQYEQVCNSAALSQMGVTCLPSLPRDLSPAFTEWILHGRTIRKDYSNSTSKSLDYLFSEKLQEQVKATSALSGSLLHSLFF